MPDQQQKPTRPRSPVERFVIQTVERLPSMYEDMAAGMPNTVHCTTCGREQAINPAHCLRHGWPRCCSNTMRLSAKSV